VSLAPGRRRADDPSVMFAAAALVILLGGAEAGAVGATPAERAEQAARRVLDGDYQREMPTGSGLRAERDVHDDKERDALARREQRERIRERGDNSVAAPIAGLMRLVAYAVVAVAVVMVLLWLFRDLRRGDPPAIEGEELPQATVDQDVLERPIGEADELARAGRYAEAIHTLLLRTLIELVRATRTRVPAALTSREILARVPLVPPARAALDALVAAVEVTHFGDEVPGAADYERCRGEFQRFADAYRGAA
jgi:hypothetical protein